MANLKYDAEIKEREVLISGNANSFVKAGAGAGKTYSIVHRIVNQILRGVSVSEIVAITFTNKSAEDLRAKIMEALDINSYDKAYQDKLTDANKRNMKNALIEIDSMHISTIHKFCGDIIRENSIYANVSPDFKILDDSEDFKRSNDVLRDYFINKIDKSTIDKVYLLQSNASNLKKDISNLYNILKKHIDKLEIGDICGMTSVPSIDLESKSKKLLDTFIEIVKIVNEQKEQIVQKLNKTDDSILFKKDETIQNIDLNNLDEIKREFKRHFTNKYFNEEFCPFNKKICKNCLDDYNKYAPEYLNDFVTIRNEMNNYYKQLVLNHAYNAYIEFLNEIQNDHDSLSNDQLLVVARDILKNNQNIRNKLKNKYKHIYIDEYQDTDHIQKNIALLLTQDDNNNFIDDSLFLVGDPKQSIYRFRGAEPKVYFDTKQLFDKPNTEKYDLNINFRSNDKILEYVNNIYSNIKLTDEAYSPMIPAADNIIDAADYSNTSNLIGVYKTSNASPEGIARLIKHIVKNYKLRKVEKENDKTKISFVDIKYKDIMVQMPSHTKMGEYVNKFAEYKIPSKVSGESDFYSIYQIRNFVNLFSGLNKRGIASIKTAKEVFRVIYPSVFNGKNEKEADNLANTILNELKSKIKGMSSYGIANYLIEHLEWINKENETLEAFEINSIKSKLYQMVEEVFTTDNVNGKDAANLFNDYISSKIEYESIIDDKADAVSIINTHKAKGLEAPIVIYACVGKFSKSTSVYKDGKLYINEGLLCYIDSTKIEEIERDNVLEQARLEYVSVTRAKEAFIFVDNDRKSVFKDVSYLNDLRVIEYEDDDSVENDSTEPCIYSPNDYSKREEEPSIVVTSPSAKENSSSATRAKEREEAKNKGIDVSPRRPSGNILGTVLHKAFELLVKEKKESNKIDMKQIVDKSIELNEDSIDDSVINSYNRFITACLNNLNELFEEEGIYKTELYPELPFIVKLDNNEISNGSIDLLSINGNEVTIYDYKSDEAEYISDDVFEVTLREKYQEQLNDYEKVVKKLYPEADIKKKIIYFRSYDEKSSSVKVKIYTI